MNSSPAVPGGSLRSKPTWSNTFGCSATSAFFMAIGDASPAPSLGIFTFGPDLNIGECNMDTQLIVLIVVLILLFGGGGGYYWRSRGRE